MLPRTVGMECETLLRKLGMESEMFPRKVGMGPEMRVRKAGVRACNRLRSTKSRAEACETESGEALTGEAKLGMTMRPSRSKSFGMLLSGRSPPDAFGTSYRYCISESAARPCVPSRARLRGSQANGMEEGPSVQPDPDL